MVGYDDVTNDQGRFVVRPGYSSNDTITVPLPPRAPDGSFDLACEANTRIRQDVVVRQPFTAKFTPTRQAVVTTMVELREPGP